jgi:hypothetical protein
MKIILLFYFIFQVQISFGQNISLEIFDYSRKLDGKEF